MEFPSDLFKGRKLLIVTKHGKENAIASVLEERLGVKCSATSVVDTDLLGTFSGEITRESDPLTTARKKCQLGMEATGYDLVIASEGSFGTHPQYFFLPADEELLVLIDSKYGLEIVARELSTDTNFNAMDVSTLQELEEFALSSKFPSHSLILRSGVDDLAGISKGISDWRTLSNVFVGLLGTSNTVRVETDMRAHHNPSRMEVIRKAAVRLADAATSTCSRCGRPGFTVTNARRGLPCADCGFPTRTSLAHLYECRSCGYVREDKFPNGKITEEPMYCDKCNP